MEMVFGMRFFIFSKANLRFAKKKLVLKSYTAVKALPITKQAKIIDKKEFALAVLNLKSETFVLYLASVIKLVYSN